jgi:hypothetical protein
MSARDLEIPMTRSNALRGLSAAVVVGARSTPASEVRSTAHVGRPRARDLFIAEDHDDDAGRVDAVAGSEFVDDRVRSVE